MTNPDPQMLAKMGNSWNPSQNTGLDENLVRAIAQYLSQGGRLRDAGTMTPNLLGGMEQGAAEQGFQQDAGLANQMYSPSFQTEPALSPEAAQQGRGEDLYGVMSGALGPASLGPQESWVESGTPFEDGSVQQETAIKSEPKPKKKKGEYSDFFKLLKAAKSGDKTTKKSLKDLAKQLEASGGEVPVS